MARSKHLEVLKRRIITVDDVCEAFKISRKTLERWRKDLGFPEPIAGSGRSLRFDQEHIESWLEHQKELNQKKERKVQ